MMKIPTILHNLFPSRNNSSASIIVEGPTDNDVLCGRDRNFSKNPGNILYRIQVERQASAYAIAATKQAKMKITKSIVHAMQTQYGSRFLRRTEANQWEVLTNVQARDKTSHALRFINNGNSSYSSQRTDEESSEQIEPRQPTEDIDAHRSSNSRVPCKNVDAAKTFERPSVAKSCSDAVDDATLAVIHQRQQALLRSSLQNDRMMDAHINDGQPLGLEQLFNSPLFSMSSFGCELTNQSTGSCMNHIGSMTMSEIRSIGGDSSADVMYTNMGHEGFNNATANAFTIPMNSFTSLNVGDDIDEQQRFDSIRTMDMVDMILNRPIEDTLRSEDINFLLNDSATMDLTY